MAISAPAAAQYMYLDSNGDGIHTSDDRMNKSAPTTVDVWLDTDSNRDGSAATCDFGTGAMDINSYEFVLQSVGGTVTYSPMSNWMPFGSNLARDFRDSTGTVYYHNGWGSPSAQPAGLYRLATLTITTATGSPEIDIIARHNINRTGRTTFGSECTANVEYDHMNRFGVNWGDVDGLAAPIDTRPLVTAPEFVLPQDGTQVQFNVVAGDADGDAITSFAANMSGLPPGHDAAFSTGPPFTSGTFTWTPTANDSGDYSVTFSAANFLIGTRTTVVHVIRTPTGVETKGAPAVNRLEQNRPNPFRPGTEIPFALAKEASVRLVVYDPAGRVIRRLAVGTLSAGPHVVRWDGRNERGEPAASGVYLCRLDAGSVRLARRMVLLR